MTSPGLARSVAEWRRDRIIAAKGQAVGTFDQLRPILRAQPGRPLAFIIDRHGERLVLRATLAARQEDGIIIGHLGIWSHASETRAAKPIEALGLGAGRTRQAITETVRIVTDAAHGRRIVTDPAGIAELQAFARKAGEGNLASGATLAAILSVEMALLNLLPLPVLDGGALLLAVAELLRRRPRRTTLASRPAVPLQQ